MQEQEKCFPRYDDTQHIDSAGTAARPTPPANGAPRVDPRSTEYTEMYCGKDSAIQ